MTDLPHLIHLVDEPPDDEQPTLPNDAILERIVLAGCLTWRTDIDDVTAAITPADLHQPRHELILHAITHLYARGDPVDIGSVTTRLRELGSLNRVGGQPYLHELATHAITPGNAGYHAHTLAALATRRRLIQAGDAIKALGYKTADDEHTLHQAALTYLKEIPRGVPGVDGSGPASSWAPVDLAELRANGLTRPTATILANSHGQGLVYPGRTHSISGESTTGKTWLGLAGICQEIAAGHPVTCIDFEDRPDTLITRLNDMGAHPDAVDTLVRYIGPDRALDPAGWAHVERAVTDCRFVLIDGVTEAMTLHGLSLLDNEDVARWYELLSRRIANLGPGVMEIDHVVKDRDSRGRYAIGGAHKLNGITGCAYQMLPGKSFAVGQPGHSKVQVAKDRHGNVGPVGHTAAELHITPDLTRHREAIIWELAPNQTTFSTTGRARLTGYMEKVSRFLETSAGTSLSGIHAGVHGNEKHIESSIQTLIEEGHLRTEPGPRNATFHYILAPYREGEDDHA